MFGFPVTKVDFERVEFGFAMTKINFEWIQFGSAGIKIDFEWTDLVKSKLSVKSFMFGFIHVKVSWTINLCVKSHLKSKGTNPSFKLEQYKSALHKHVKINFYVPEITFASLDSKAKHTQFAVSNFLGRIWDLHTLTWFIW